jgi:hypothetical protein
MKTRSGFISNSSTSSFVILGVPKPSKDVLKKFGELEEAFNEGETKTAYKVDDEYGQFAGVVLGQSYDGNTTDVPLGQIMELAPGLASLLGVAVEQLRIMGVEVAC